MVAQSGLLRLVSICAGLTLVSGVGILTKMASPWAVAAEERGAGEEPEAEEETNPLGANAACYICHIPFVKDELSKTHLKGKIACTACHGVSAGHANDEEIGATPPDKTFKRREVNKHCRECHESHDVKPEKVVALYRKRGLSSDTVVCTDCHGAHRIERAGEAGDVKEEKLRAVIWIGGFAHEFEKIAETLLEGLPGRLPIELEVVRDGKFLDELEGGKRNGKPLDVIILSHCVESAEGALTLPQKKRFLELVRGGLGVVALHASYYSFVKWEEGHELFGARFIQHGSSEATLVVDIVDREHPITKGLDGFEIVSELYESTPLADDCHVLARAREKDSKKSHPSAWTRRYGKGRVVTVLPGHFPRGYRLEGFQKLISRSISWAAGRLDPGDR